MHLHVAHLYLVRGDIQDAERSLRRRGRLPAPGPQGGDGVRVPRQGLRPTRDGRLDEARHELEEALAIFEETEDETDLTRALNELARVERLEGRMKRARELLERSITIMGASDAPILA